MGEVVGKLEGGGRLRGRRCGRRWRSRWVVLLCRREDFLQRKVSIGAKVWHSSWIRDDRPYCPSINNNMFCLLSYR